jgi:hypothetical protein
MGERKERLKIEVAPRRGRRSLVNEVRYGIEARKMPPFRWEDLDHSLVRLRLIDLAEEMNRQMQADERRIQFENRDNMNSSAVPSLVMKMKQESVDEQARRVYDIYCDVWQAQGHAKSAAYVRFVYLRGILPVLRARTGAIASEFSRFAGRTSFPAAIRDAYLQSLRLNMGRLEGRWRRYVEIEAKECEYAEQRLRASQQASQSAQVVTTKMPSGGQAEPIRQASAGEGHPEVHKLGTGSNRRKPGRSPKLAQTFVFSAGALWQKAISGSPTRVSSDQLRQIASALDAGGHVPPSSYLEGKYARELKDFNRRNSNSKIGPLKTWSQLVSHGDKDHLQGMRRLLSRCAEKVDEDHPPSGINSGQKTSS